MDLPCIIRQSQKKRHTREHKRKLGKSIDLCDKSIDSRKEFGHWELDTVRGIKNRNDQVLVSLLERKTRLYIALRCHPCSPGERGSNERHNGLLRRFIPKGTPIKDVSEATLQRALNWYNNLPRKLLHYKTPQEVLVEEINKVMDLESVQFHIVI